MKILVIGSTKDNSLENFIFRNFPESDSVVFFDSETLSLSKCDRFLLRMGFNFVLDPYNKSIRNYIDDKFFDVIFVFKGFGILQRTISFLRKRCTIISNLNPDHPFIRYKLSHGGSYIEKSINHYNLYFSYDKKVVQKINDKYNCKAFFIPFGYDIENNEYENIKNNDDNEVIEACFIGDGDLRRFFLLSYLAFCGFKINIYGSNWKRWYRIIPNLRFNKSLDRHNLYKIFRSYRVQLNLLRKHNLDSFNMRTFEIPSAGGIQLMTFTSVIYDYFAEGSEIFVFKNLNELKSKLQYLLSIDHQNALDFRFKSRFRSLKNGNSYKEISYKIRNILLEEIKIKKQFKD